MGTPSDGSLISTYNKRYRMSEVWKPIKGYEGIYEVSDLGRVRSLPRMLTDSKGRRHPVPMKMLKMHDRKGYDSVTLQDMGRKAIMSVHRLVAMAFIPNPDNLPVVNHRDENPKNNQVSNLEWCDISYNTRYGTGVERAQAKHVYHRKAVEQLTKDGQHVATFKGVKEAARATGADASVIVRVCKGRNETAGGYRWKYL